MISKSSYSLFIMFCVLVIVFFSHMLCLSVIEIQNDHANSINIDAGYTYINVQHETDPLQLPNDINTIEQFKLIHKLLNESNSCYYEIYNQPLFNISTSNGIMFEQAHSVQVSCNVQESFRIELSTGNYFYEQDYILSENDKIPAILGSDYIGLVDIGDTFSAEYLFSSFTFEIVGFLSEDANINTSSVYINLNDAIVIPSFEFDYYPITDNDYVTQKIQYANKTSGKIKTTQESLLDTYQYIQGILAESKVGEYSISFSTFKNALLSKGISLAFIGGLVLCIFLGFILLLLILINRMKKEESFCSVLQKRLIAIVCISYICSALFSVRVLILLGYKPTLLLKQIPLLFLLIMILKNVHKRILALVLLLALVFSLCACGV